jgi:hypothetical protein
MNATLGQLNWEILFFRLNFPKCNLMHSSLAKFYYAKSGCYKESVGYQQALRRYHTHMVHPRAFLVFNLVLRRVHTKKGKHRLGGAILGSRSTPTQGISTPGDQWRNIPQRMEYRTAKEVLPMVLSFLFYFIAPLFLPSSSGMRTMMTCMWADAGVPKDFRLFSGPHGVNTMAVRLRTLAKCSKGCCIRLHSPPTPHIPRPLHQGIRPPYPKWVTWLLWACQCLGFEGETRQSGQSRPKQPERGTKQHKGWPAIGASRAP